MTKLMQSHCMSFHRPLIAHEGHCTSFFESSTLAELLKKTTTNQLGSKCPRTHDIELHCLNEDCNQIKSEAGKQHKSRQP